MKKKCIIVLLATTLLLTGCNATYQITFDENAITENITFEADELREKSPVDGNITDLEAKVYYAYDEASENTKYHKKITKKKDKYEVNLSYSHAPERFNEAIVFKYFKYHIFLDNDTNYYLKCTGGLLKGIENSINGTINVKIKTNQRVLQNNADAVEGNTYIWKITKSNAPDKEILFQVSKIKKEIVQKDGNLIVTGVIFFTLLTVLPLLMYIVGKKIIDKLIPNANR